MNKGFGAVAVILVVAVVLAIAGGVWYYKVHQPASASPIAGRVYSNEYMTVTVPPGWTIPQVSSDTPTITITKGDYILSINTRAAQASGITGGRFGEIAGPGASVGDVVTQEPAGPCGSAVTSTVTVNGAAAIETDFYVGPNDATMVCAAPTNGNKVWYFSYVSHDGGYFNYYPGLEPLSWVITMSYDGKDINSLPVKNSIDLNDALAQMSGILKTLVIDPPILYVPAISGEIKNMNDTGWSSQSSQGAGVFAKDCTDGAATDNAKNNVQVSYEMDSLGPNNNSSTLYGEGDVLSRIATVEGILAGAGWSKCNTIQQNSAPGARLTTTDAIDVYSLGNEFVDVVTNSFIGINGPVWSVVLDFSKLKT